MSDAETDSRLPERTFGWWDMFVHPDDDPRTDGGPFDHDHNGDFDGAVGDPSVVEEAFTRGRSECEYTDRVVREAPNLDAAGAVEDDQLRETLLHLVEEYARQLGHAECLRERIDGRVGQ